MGNFQIVRLEADFYCVKVLKNQFLELCKQENTKGIRIFYGGQPKPEEKKTSKTCHKCLESGHLFFQCPNGWKCKACNEIGHKMDDCPSSYENMFKEEIHDDNQLQASEGKHSNTEVENSDAENESEESKVENEDDKQR